MNSPLRHRPVNVSHVRDVRLRAVLQEIDSQLRTCIETVGQALEGDQRHGMVRVTAPVVLQDLPDNPTERSTMGRDGELGRRSGRVYLKRFRNAEDRNWVPLLDEDTAPLGYMTYSTGTSLPAAPAGPPQLFILKRQPAKGDAVYILIQKDNSAWDWLLVAKRDVG